MNDKEILSDYLLANISRQLSIAGRREVLLGKAKLGIFGSGKELAQIALAKQIAKGDWRSGYYRDQTLMLALGEITPFSFFTQLYGVNDINLEPCSGGRNVVNHFGSRLLNKKGEFKNLLNQFNSTSDVSPTASQMPRLLGLAFSSKYYRNNKAALDSSGFSNNGNEVAFGTIGNASTSEGVFFETINAAGVLQVPMLCSVWDDGYGISVTNKLQTTKESISEALQGFQKNKDSNGILIYKVKGWNYKALLDVYSNATDLCRNQHIPILIHVEELTQPEGHASTGSHERYKSSNRLKWESEYDCLLKFEEFIILNNFSNPEDLKEIKEQAKEIVKQAKKEAFNAYKNQFVEAKKKSLHLISKLKSNNSSIKELQKNEVNAKKIISISKSVLREHVGNNSLEINNLKNWLKQYQKVKNNDYSSHLYSDFSFLNQAKIELSAKKEMIDGREVINRNFSAILKSNHLVSIFGEDVGLLGDVNKSLEGLQELFGENRVFDTGIREATIVGQAIGMALRGLRPICEIQYLDYILYAIQILSDDVASLYWRTKGGQKCPIIVRTRGHRLEGVWHSGSPIGMLINSLKGFVICVPRNFTKAAAMYNTLLQQNNPALVIEPLNGYRSKEPAATNYGEFTTTLGISEILVQGCDITIVSYGSTLNVVLQTVKYFLEVNLSVEIIDVQTLIPFDTTKIILESIKKTKKVLFIDEDVPGGATAFMLQQVVEEQQAYLYLDTPPRTLTAKNHRPAYGTDGDYFSKPNSEEIFDTVYRMMQESNPEKYTNIYA